jgi:hypothetical protein
LPIDRSPLPADVQALVVEAERRIECFQHDSRVPGFVPCDFSEAYRVLRAVTAAALPGQLFCEWGSGFGVATCLAAMLDFEAWGIEIDGELVREARQLAHDFDLPAEFVRGSFIPRGSNVPVEGDGFAWLDTEEDDTQLEMDLGPDDFNLIFAYPWPDEERAVSGLFERHAMTGAVLLTYSSNGSMRLRRKIANKSKRQPRR